MSGTPVASALLTGDEIAGSAATTLTGDTEAGTAAVEKAVIGAGVVRSTLPEVESAYAVTGIELAAGAMSMAVDALAMATPPASDDSVMESAPALLTRTRHNPTTAPIIRLYDNNIRTTFPETTQHPGQQAENTDRRPKLKQKIVRIPQLRPDFPPLNGCHLNILCANDSPIVNCGV